MLAASSEMRFVLVANVGDDLDGSEGEENGLFVTDGLGGEMVLFVIVAGAAGLVLFLGHLAGSPSGSDR